MKDQNLNNFILTLFKTREAYMTSFITGCLSVYAHANKCTNLCVSKCSDMFSHGAECRRGHPLPSEFILSRWPEQEEEIKQQSIIRAAESPHVCFKTTSDLHQTSWDACHVKKAEKKSQIYTETESYLESRRS